MSNVASYGLRAQKNGLLAKVSCAALMCGIASLSQPALAQSKVVDQVNRGANGSAWRDRVGQTPIIDSSPGGSAAGWDFESSASSSLSTTSSTAVEIGAVGGNGALGMSWEKAGTRGASPGKDGGSGGDVRVTQSGGLQGRGDQANPTALFLIYSLGGDGRVGPIVHGKGGQGGTVTLTVNANVETEGKGFAAIWARSVSGQTGRNEKYYDDGRGGRLTAGNGWVVGVNADKATDYPGTNGNTVSIQVVSGKKVTTKGAGAPAIIAESIGGAGMDGGTIRQVLPGAGQGGTVNFANEGTISTDGETSAAVLLQSIGGRGGNQIVQAPNPGYMLGSGGGKGGAGGNGGTVSATQTGRIETKQAYSFGLAAYSVGGVGGQGSSAFINDGGDGGAAGNGGAVTVSNAGAIETHGKGSIGIIAQSLGAGSMANAFQTSNIRPTTGGGGSGGGSTSVFFSSKAGKGGAGGNGGEVKVENTGKIATEGASAFGILAQSVGGGGGAGGSANTAFSLFLGASTGGKGGGGGNGSLVTVGNAFEWPKGSFTTSQYTGEITTKGKSASAIVAQSIGGGGGAGGSAKAVSVGAGAALSFAVGGDGGDGGNGARVKVYNSSLLTTRGDFAHGIEARSAGGGGGRGGDASAYALSLPTGPYPSLSLAFAVGGSGGIGGHADWVDVWNAAPIATNGVMSHGIFASSVGGGGGSGGSAEAIAETLGLYKNVNVSLALGGTGGGGGNGGSIRVLNYNTITTANEFSMGLLASSIGGGGGSGGLATSTASKSVAEYGIMAATLNAVSVADTVSISAALGGSGGKGGNGDFVNIGNYSNIITTGKEAKGIVAQSIGGGGGNAGGYLSKGSGELALSIGGSRRSDAADGGGGNGGRVAVYNGGLIQTKRSGATAILAQSIGGGGGAGGSSAGQTFQTKFSQSTTSAIQELAVTGWKLYKQNEKLTSTTKTVADNLTKLAEAKKAFANANGIFSSIWKGKDVALKTLATVKDAVQSDLKPLLGKLPEKPKTPLSVSVAVGGSGGNGGNGDSAAITNSGSIITEGNIAHGLFAQSIGGGGGVGGGAVTSSSNVFSANVAIGGSGGSGGKGGPASIDHRGSISTLGNASFGMFAQSIGGGGGVGGATANSDVLSFISTAKVGGSSGKTSNGGSVYATNAGTITTQGRDAHAIVAQSVGGGGGLYVVNNERLIDPEAIRKLINDNPEFKDAQISAEEARILTDTLLAALGLSEVAAGASNGYGGVAMSRGTLVSSPSVDATIGGRASTGGNGGEVNISHSGFIATEGVGAFGIFGQSIGGGGGFGSDASANASKLNAALGGSDSASGNGGGIALNFDKKATIATSGDGASAVFLQSIGGGGGYGGSGEGKFTVSDATPRLIVSPGIPPYGLPSSHLIYFGASGNGGAISVSMKNPEARLAISTAGARAHGIFAQSLGGGGGTAFITDGGNTPVSSNAQSRMSQMRGSGGAITVATVGDIEAKGAGSYGLFLQSGVQKVDGTLDPARSGGLIKVTHTGKIVGGSGDGAAIRIDGGSDNIIEIGAGSEVSAVSRMAIMGSYAKESVFNSGKIIGDIDLAAGNSTEANVFENRAGGTWQSNPGIGQLRLGPGKGTFTNQGILDIGGIGTIASLSVNGGVFKQDASGSILVDVTSTPAAGQPRSDLLSIAGAGGSILGIAGSSNAAVTLGGTIKASVVGGLKPEEFRVVSTSGTMSGTISASSSSSAAPFTWQARQATTNTPLALVRGSVLSQTSRDIYIKPQANFAPVAGIPATSSEQSLMRYLQNAWNAGSVSDRMAQTFGSFARVTSSRDYMQGIDSLVPEESSSTLVTQTLNARAAMHAALSCPIFQGSGTLMAESDCAWARIGGTWTNQNGSADVAGYDRSAMTYRAGVQREIANDWFFGATAGFTQSWLNDDDGYSSTDGNGVDAALSLKRQMGPWLFALSGHLGYGSYETDRVIDVGPDIARTNGTANVLTAGGRFRASYEFAFPSWYVKPYADFDVLHTYMPGYREQGTGPMLDFSSAQQWNFAFSPNLEVGGRFDLSPSLWLRPYASVGMTFLAKDSMPVGVSLSDASDAIGNFTTEVTIPSTLVNLSAGVQLFDTKGYELRAEYQADFGNNYVSQELRARFAVQF